MTAIQYRAADTLNDIPVSEATPLPVGPPAGGLPSNANGVAVQIGNTSGNVANAIAIANLTGVAGKTNYITGFKVTGSGATAALPVTVKLTGVTGGERDYTYGAAAGVLVMNNGLDVQFPGGLAATAANTTILVTCPALGSGNTNNTVTAEGYQL
jgi:hypothetical protein